ncbi:MAG: hypothetical protein JNL97_09510, partial [Verrucomicrobiales bacterium]|nr:hypothetical protein [Verrucomicrobiales bacterium]
MFQPGSITEIDLASDTVTRTVSLTNAPLKVVVTDDRVVVAVHAVPPDTFASVRLIDMRDGRQGPAEPTTASQPVGYFTLDPSQRSFFVPGFRISARPVCRVFFDPATLATTDVRVSPQPPGTATVLQQPPFASSDGLLVTFPLLYRGSTDPAEDMRLIPSALDPRAGLQSDVVFDSARGAFLVAGSQGITIHRRDTFEAFAFVELPWAATAILRGDEVLAVTAEPGQNRKWVSFPNPSVGLPENVVPVAEFSWSPDRPTTRDLVTLDAGASRDDGPTTSPLEYRWDLDGDGSFDTEWSTTPKQTFRFLEAQDHRVLLEVRDRFLATHIAVKTIPVVLGEDPGEPGPGPTGQPFAIEARLKRVVFAPTTPVAYGLHEDGQTLYRWKLDDGRADRQWRFDVPAVDLALTPDGRRLWLAHSTNHAEAFVPPLGGSISGLDTERGTIVREFRISMNPSALAATDSGILLVTATAPGRTVKLVHAASGAVVGTESLTQLSPVALHPSQSRFYVSGEANPPDARRVEFDPTTGSRTRGRSYPVALPPVLFVLPGGTHLVSEAGTLVRLSTNASSDLVPERDLPVSRLRSVVPVAARSSIALLDRDAFVHLDATTLEPWLRQSIPPDALAAGLWNDRLYGVYVEPAGTRLVSRPIPARTPAENTAPVVALSPASSDPIVVQLGSAASFEATAADADGRVENVVWQVDGVDAATTSEAPYAWSWTPESGGRYQVRAVARDNLGSTRATEPRVVIVNAPPTVTIEAPTAADTLLSPVTFVARAGASDTDGTVARVEWTYQPPFGGGPIRRLGTNTVAPFELQLVDFVGIGGTLSAVAVDNLEGRATANVALRLQGRAGDAFDRPLLLVGVEASGTTDIRSATMEPLEPRWLRSNTGSGTVWWRWTAPEDGWVELTTDGSTFDTVIEVFTNSVISRLLPLRDNDDDPGRIPLSRTKVGVTAGGDLRIRVFGTSPSEVGDASLKLRFHPRPAASSEPPEYDARERATALAGS